MAGGYEQRLHEEHVARRARLGMAPPKPVVLIPKVEAVPEPKKRRRRRKAIEATQEPALPSGLNAAEEAIRSAEATLPSRIKTIQIATAAYYGIERRHLVGNNRAARFAGPRLVAYFLCRELLGLTILNLARHLRRDHSTVYVGAKKIERQRAEDPAFAAQVDPLLALLRERLAQGEQR